MEFKRLMGVLSTVLVVLLAGATWQDRTYSKLYECKRQWVNPNEDPLHFSTSNAPWVNVYSSIRRPGLGKLELFSGSWGDGSMITSLTDVPTNVPTNVALQKPNDLVLTMEVSPLNENDIKVFRVQAKGEFGDSKIASIQRWVNGKVKYTWAKYVCGASYSVSEYRSARYSPMRSPE